MVQVDVRYSASASTRSTCKNNLHQIISFPPFPGLENNYLRAQIARISAATHVAPQDYYAMNEEEEEEEQSPENLEMDPDFEAPTMREQAEKSLDGWVHQVPYILPQVIACGEKVTGNGRKFIDWVV